MLGGDVRRLEHRSFLGMHRAHIDDAAAATRFVHVRDARARGQERAVDVDREHLLPLGVAELLDRMHDLDTGVADQDIDASESCDDSGDTVVDRSLVGDVHGNTDGLASARPHLVCGRLSGVLVEVGDRQLRALTHIHPRDVFADAARGAGDDCGFALELHFASHLPQQVRSRDRIPERRSRSRSRDASSGWRTNGAGPRDLLPRAGAPSLARIRSPSRSTRARGAD